MKGKQDQMRTDAMTDKLKGRPTPKVAAPTSGTASPDRVSPEARERMIAAAAYSLAEQRGFQNGSPEDDWLRAEREVDEFLTETRRARSGLDPAPDDSSASQPIA